jgi:hypothetical protein
MIGLAHHKYIGMLGQQPPQTCSGQRLIIDNQYTHGVILLGYLEKPTALSDCGVACSFAPRLSI